MSADPHWAEMPDNLADSVSSNGANHVVLMVLDHLGARPELKQVLKLRGYRVVDTDNGQDAARNARQTHPDLLLVDMDLPLLYGLVAARQIIKNAQLGSLPVVIVTHDDVLDPAPMVELGATRNEYVTRLSDYEELQPLLDYLLPASPPMSDSRARDARGDTTLLTLLPASVPGLHQHRDAAPGKPDLNSGPSVYRTSRD